MRYILTIKPVGVVVHVFQRGMADLNWRGQSDPFS